MANKYVLSGGDIQIDYTIGANPSFTALSFTQDGNTWSFKPNEITTDQTGLGMLVSFNLIASVDAGGTRFGVFLPAVQLTEGQQVAVTTVGMFERYPGPDASRLPTRWQAVALQGTASEVIVPLLVPTHSDA